MALTNLNTTINSLRERATTARTNYQRAVTATRADRYLTDDGKRPRIASAYRTLETTLRNLHEQEEAALNDTRNTLERRVFGQFSKDPAAIIAYRDAQERAANLTRNNQSRAAELLRTATLSDDPTLAAAIVSRAMTFGWQDIVNQYVTYNPAGGEALRDLADLTRFQQDTSTQLDAAAAYTASPPSELARLTPTTIDRIAEEAKAEATLSTPSGIHRMAEALA